MVDRQARDVAADALANFMRGAITNFEFDLYYPRSRVDEALASVHGAVWAAYSDVREYKLDERHELPRPTRQLWERCLLFLRSDLEFAWPPVETGIRFLVLRLLGFGRWLERREREYVEKGDIAVWPFLDVKQYETAKTDNAPMPGDLIWNDLSDR